MKKISKIGLALLCVISTHVFADNQIWTVQVVNNYDKVADSGNIEPIKIGPWTDLDCFLERDLTPQLLEYGNISHVLSIEENNYWNDIGCRGTTGYLYRSVSLMINGNKLHMNSDYGISSGGISAGGFPIRTVTWAGNQIVVAIPQLPDRSNALNRFIDSNKNGTLEVGIYGSLPDITHITVTVSNGGIQGFCKTSDGNTTPYVCCANGKGTSKWMENTNWTRDLNTACKADINLINPVSKSASNCKYGTNPIYVNTPNTINTLTDIFKTICKNGDFTVYREGFGPSR
jgi:hypothetical protein